MTQNRRNFFKILGTGLIAPVVLLQSVCNQRPRKPNIIFIMADDLGYGDLGCYGQTLIKTPHIDQMAREGMRFTNCYAGSAVCAPSRNALMTGQHTGHCTIRGNHPKKGGRPSPYNPKTTRLPLAPEDFTVAQMLKQAGYATGIAGKWGLGESDTDAVPNGKGFDEWLGFLNQDHAVFYYADYLWRNEKKMPIPENMNGQRGKYVHDLFTQFTLDFITENKDHPFFFYGAYTIPHADYEVPDTHLYEEQPWLEEAKIYASMVSRLDNTVGQIFNLLKQLGIDQNTIVFFCSDNGANSRPMHRIFNSVGTLRGNKGELYEGGIRTPMIVRWPGKISANTVNQEATWYFPDFLPTVAELADITVPGNIDGFSVLPVLLGKSQSELEQRFLYWEYPRKNEYLQAIRHGRWKAVRHHLESPFELYDLSQDPQEQNNVAEQNRAVVERIFKFAKIARTESENFPSL